MKRITQEEKDYIKQHYGKVRTFEIANHLGRTVIGINKAANALGLKKREDRAKVGDIVNGWLITEIFFKKCGNQQVSMAKIVSKIGEPKEKIARLSLLTLGQISSPDKPKTTSHINKLIEFSKTHGMSKTRIYSIWNGMKNRCNIKYANSYPDYSGRGISICEEWMDFLNFKNWAFANGYTDELSLDRIDVDGNYCPENCRWITHKEQSWNKQNSKSSKIMITAFNETKSAIEWTKDKRCNVALGTLLYRIRNDWKSEIAITKKSERKFNKRLCLTDWLIENYPDIYKEYRGL